MEQRLNFVTLAVSDWAASRAFYVDGLGWNVEFEAPGEVVFLRVGSGLILSLWTRAGFVEEIGVEPASGVAPLTLAHNVASPEEVDAILREAAAFGASVTLGARRDWGGYSGYLTDPDGFRWEIAHNPTPLGEEVVSTTRSWLASRSATALSREQVATQLRRREPLFHREPRDAGRRHIEDMVAPGMVHVGASGLVRGRAEVVEEVVRRYEQSDHGDDESWQVEDFEVEELASGLWSATYVLHQGSRVSRRWTLWELAEGRWRVRRHQGTVVPS